MIKYFVVDNTLFKFDGEKLIAPERGWISVRDYFLVDEDGTIGDQEVHAGDIVVTYYGDNGTGTKFTIHSKGTIIADMVTKSIENRKKNRDNKIPCDCECKVCSPA